MRGSLRPSAIRAERTSRRASFTLRIRSAATLLPQYVLRGSDTAFEANCVWKLREDVALEVIHRTFQRTEIASDQARRQRRPLPEIVMIGLGDAGAEAPLQL